MRSVAVVLILAGCVSGLSGCRTDRGSQQSSDLGSRPSSAPAQAARLESAQDSAIANPAPRTAAEDRRPVLVCFGDSLTAGHGTDAGQSYPDYLQALLDQRGFHYRVVNEGVSGDTTKDGLERIGTVIAMKPSVVVVEFGGNDGLRGVRIEDSRANLDAIVQRLKASGTKVALAGITLPPDYGPDYIHQFDQTYALLASKYHVPMIPFLLRNVYGVDGMMQEDRTHATAAGNRVVAANVASLVEPLLRK